MGYVHFGEMRGVLALNPSNSIATLDRIGKSCIAEEDVVKMARELYQRLDKRFHLDSSSWYIKYLPERHGNTLGYCHSIPSMGMTLGIVIFPDALVSYDVFWDVLKHEYAHAVANYRWGGDSYYETHSKHGRLWQEVAKEVGCKAKKSQVLPGKYFTHAICDKDKVLFYAVSLKEAEDKLTEMNALKRDKDLDLVIVEGEVLYQKYLKEYVKRRASFNPNQLSNIQNLRDIKNSTITQYENEIMECEKQLQDIASSVEDFESLLIAKARPIVVNHSVFGEGMIQGVLEGKIKAIFCDGKEVTLGLKKVIELNLLSFPEDPDIMSEANILQNIIAKEGVIFDRYSKAWKEKEKAQTCGILAFVSQDERLYA